MASQRLPPAVEPTLRINTVADGPQIDPMIPAAQRTVAFQTELTLTAAPAGDLPATAAALSVDSTTSRSTAAASTAIATNTSSSIASSTTTSSPSSSSHHAFTHTSSASISSNFASLSSTASSPKPSLVAPIAGTLLAIIAVASAGALWFVCFRKRTRPPAHRRSSGSSGWTPFARGGTRQLYSDEPEANADGNAGTARMDRGSAERGRPPSRNRLSGDTFGSDYLLSSISHASTFDPTLDQHAGQSPSYPSSHPDRPSASPDHQLRPPPTPTSPLPPLSPTQPPTRAKSYSFLRNTTSPLAGLVAALFPSTQDQSSSVHPAPDFSREASFQSSEDVSRTSTLSRILASPTTQTAFKPVSPGESVEPLLNEDAAREEVSREPSPRPVLGRVKEGRREVSRERRAEEGWTGEVGQYPG